MKIMKTILFTIALIISAQGFAMEASPAPPAPIPVLPADVWRHMIPFVAECNAYKVAEVVRCLNATNKFFNGCVQTEEIMVKILNRMPYTANAITLFNALQAFPVMKKDKLKYEWRYANAARALIGGQSLLVAILNNDQKKVAELLAIKNIDLENLENINAIARGHEVPLNEAIRCNHKEVFDALLNAGADVNWHCTKSSDIPLGIALQKGSAEMVQKLLKAGADPEQQTITNIGNTCDLARFFYSQSQAVFRCNSTDSNAELVSTYKTMMELLDRALFEKKEKLKRYQNQKNTAPGYMIALRKWKVI